MRYPGSCVSIDGGRVGAIERQIGETEIPNVEKKIAFNKKKTYDKLKSGFVFFLHFMKQTTMMMTPTRARITARAT